VLKIKKGRVWPALNELTKEGEKPEGDDFSAPNLGGKKSVVKNQKGGKGLSGKKKNAIGRI